VKRTVSEARVGQDRVRYRVKIEDDPSLPGWNAETRFVQFLVALTEAPDLLNCGFNKPQKLVFFHSGEGWVAEGEATVSES
jgi:hypothetical protein